MDKWIKKINTSPSAKKKSLTNAVFGGSLAYLVHDKKTNVPLIVANICRYIENKGLCLEGLFRVNGSAKLIEKYKNIFRLSNGNELIVNENEEPGYDIHALAGLLKLFLRELKDGVIPEKYTSEIVKIFPDHEEKRCIESLISLIKRIPSENCLLLNFMIKFLSNVLKNEKKNLMSSKSLGIIFGPCIFKCCISPHGLKIQGFFNHLMTILINYYEDIFEEEFQSIIEANQRKTSSKSTQSKKSVLPRRESVGVLLDCTRNNSSSGSSSHIPPSSSLFDLAANLIRSRGESLANSKETSRQDLTEESPVKMREKDSPQTSLGCKNVPLLAKEIACIITNISQSNNATSKSESLDTADKGGFRKKKMSYPFIGKIDEIKPKDELNDEVWQVMIVGTENQRVKDDLCRESPTTIAQTVNIDNDRNLSENDLKNFLIPPKSKYDFGDESRDNSISLNITSNSDQGLYNKNNQNYITMHNERSDESNEKMDFEEDLNDTPEDILEQGHDRGNQTPNSCDTSSTSSYDSQAKCKHDLIDRQIVDEKPCGYPVHSSSNFIHHSYSMISPGLSQDSSMKKDESFLETPATLEEFSVLLEQVLDEQRSRCRRPKNIEDMTWDQVEKEKTDLQKGLLYFERLYGHPNNHHSKRVMKSFYDRYRIVKKLVAIHNSQKQNQTGYNLDPHSHHQQQSSHISDHHHTQDSINLTSKISDNVQVNYQDRSLKIIRSKNSIKKSSRKSLANNNSTSSDNNNPCTSMINEHSPTDESEQEFSQRILTLPKEDLHNELDKYLAHKVRIQRKLCSFETYIEKSLGRKPNKTDRDIYRQDYNNYRMIKLRIATLNRLLVEVDERIDADNKEFLMVLHKSGQSSGRSTNKENTCTTLHHPASTNSFNFYQDVRQTKTEGGDDRPIVHLRRKNAHLDSYLTASGSLPPSQFMQATSSVKNYNQNPYAPTMSDQVSQQTSTSNYYDLGEDHIIYRDKKIEAPPGQLHYFQQQRNPADQRKVFCLYENKSNLHANLN